MEAVTAPPVEDMRMALEKVFYAKKFRFSYSSLNKLLWNPAVFYQHYIMGNKEDRLDSYLVNGKLIHAMLLEKNNIDKLFVVSPAKLPSAESLRPLIDKVYRHYISDQVNNDKAGYNKLGSFSAKILELMKEMDYFQKLVSDAQRLDKVITPETNSYWDFLKKKSSSVVLVDQLNYDICDKAAHLVKTNSTVCRLLGMNTTDFDNIEVFNEQFLVCELEGRPFGLHGILDNQVVNHDRRVIYINDLKNTNRDLKDFPETIEYYGYWIQAAIYMVLAALKYEKLLAKGYTMEFHFVVIDASFKVYPFPVRQATLDSWNERLGEALEKAEWHYRNNSYDLPYEFATGGLAL
jgi:hypothetical protein